jgi:D-aminopeptidase
MAQPRVRARDLGLAPGVFQAGALNAITDVPGVRVGQVTVQEGDSVRTGVTAILPHGGNLYRDRVPAALHVGNGFGKLLGATQLQELGELETPILLTCTLCVWKAADAMVEWLLGQPQMGGVRSINPVVAETNDGGLNAIRSRPISAAHVTQALASAAEGPVLEGSVGAGTGTAAFGWKGGIGTSSRKLPANLGGWTVGVVVQSNFGGVLQMMGAPVGRELGRYSFRTDTTRDRGDGSIIMVVATDAPLSDRNLDRCTARDDDRAHQRRHVGRFPGDRRGDRGSDLQLADDGHVDDEPRPHGGSTAARPGPGDPAEIRHQPDCATRLTRGTVRDTLCVVSTGSCANQRGSQ